MFLWRLPIHIHSKSSIADKKRNEAKYLTRNSTGLKLVSPESNPLELTLSWRRPLSYRNQSIRNHWTGFYMITGSVMKELNFDLINENCSLFIAKIKSTNNDFLCINKFLSILQNFTFIPFSYLPTNRIPIMHHAPF